MACCAIVFQDDDVAFVPAGRRWELDPWRRTPHLALSRPGAARLH